MWPHTSNLTGSRVPPVTRRLVIFVHGSQWCGLEYLHHRGHDCRRYGCKGEEEAFNPKSIVKYTQGSAMAKDDRQT